MQPPQESRRGIWSASRSGPTSEACKRGGDSVVHHPLPAGFIGRRHAIYAPPPVISLDERGNGMENLAARDYHIPVTFNSRFPSRSRPRDKLPAYRRELGGERSRYDRRKRGFCFDSPRLPAVQFKTPTPFRPAFFFLTRAENVQNSRGTLWNSFCNCNCFDRVKNGARRDRSRERS